MENPYRAPTADEGLPEPAPGNWTIRSLLRDMWQAFKRQPFGASGALFVVPLCWAMPAEWLRGLLVQEDWGTLGGEHGLYFVLSSWCVQAWSTICYPGAQLAALRLAAGERIRWRDFIAGVRKLPFLLLLGLGAGIPLDLVAFLPLPSVVNDGLTILVFVGVMFFMIRTLTWASLLLLTRHSFWQAFELSWAATRGHTWRIVALFFVLILIASPMIATDVTLELRYVPLGMSTFGALMILAAAQIYVSTPAPVESASVSTGRESISSIPPPSAA